MPEHFAAAYRAMEKAGYKKNDEGYYEKDGKKLTLHMVTYSARADLPILMQLAASQLTTAGIDDSSQKSASSRPSVVPPKMRSSDI